MIHARYSRWNGGRDRSFRPDEVFDRLNEHLDDTGDLQQSMRRLMQRGMGEEDDRVSGLDELLSRVAREKRRMYEQYQIRSALDEIQERLQDIVADERKTLQQQEDRAEAEKKDEFLQRLPPKLSDAIERLAGYGFENPRAEEDFREILSQLEKIRRLENYIRREGNLFRGKESLGFEEAAELQERMEGLQKLEGQLSGSHPGDVEMDLLDSLLGDRAREDYEGVMRLESSLEDGGYVVDKGDRFELTPRGVRRIGQMALRDIHKQLGRDAAGRHAIARRGSQEPVPESSKPYVSGDALNLNLNETLKSALRRNARTPLDLDPRDFMVLDSEYSTRAATVLLLDMSWSMSWDGRFAAAKKVALAMESLCRSRYPQDYFGIVGFFTRAVELKARDLPEATWNMGDPFTNLQDGLRLAIELLRKRSSTRNQQIVVITDGQPTAYCRQGRLYCEWPLSFGGISQRAAEETLKEAKRVTQRGITINTFMLDDSPVLKGFVDEMTRINKGRAFYTRPDRLGRYLLVDYLLGQRRKV